MSTKVKQIILDNVIKAIEEGKRLPWSRPWNENLTGPANIAGNVYHGLNVWICYAAMNRHGYKSRYWLTANQMKERGLNWAGKSPTQIVFWKRVTKKNEDSESDDSESYFMMRFYNVWNVDQIDGAEKFVPAEKERPTIAPIDAAATMVARMPKLPEIKHFGNRAYYTPREDSVTMPPMDTFKTSAGYYKVLFHELAHATGHQSRLGRHTPEQLFAPFGSPEYSREELTAEITAAMLCGECEIDPDIDNSTAYLQGWLTALRNDLNLLFDAASKAEKARSYIMRIGNESETDDEE